MSSAKREREYLGRREGGDLSAEEVRALLRDPEARKLHVVRRALAAHPRTPRGEAMSLVPTLFWRDLAWISADARAHPQVRRAADQEILRRVPGLAASERAELARIAGPGTVAVLRKSGEPSTVRALLRNRFAVEGDVVFMAITGRDPDSLEAIALDAVWGLRIAVRAAVARNRFTPLPLAEGLLSVIPLGDLREICAERWRAPGFLEIARATLAFRTETGTGRILPA
ncbi:MAG TPA: hypothetical protein VFS34_09430 [Thermoanaerobaculia bacterium]|nr:hypothetical protein [Thermoanaerobaculia bacterium]